MRENRSQHMILVQLPNGERLELSPGAHNELQAAIIHDFAPRFAPGAHLLYLGDTANKTLLMDRDKLSVVGFSTDKHSKFPDVVLHDVERNWLFLIEAVTSHGPVTPKRLLELEQMLRETEAGKIYVSAFANNVSYVRFATTIAWETDVWLASAPDHMIHFNGDRFLGPR